MGVHVLNTLGQTGQPLLLPTALCHSLGPSCSAAERIYNQTIIRYYLLEIEPDYRRHCKTNICVVEMDHGRKTTTTKQESFVFLRISVCWIIKIDKMADEMLDSCLVVFTYPSPSQTAAVVINKRAVNS